MLRLILLTTLLTLLVAPAQAQDEAKSADVAPLTSFAILVTNIKDGDKVSAIRIMDNGQVGCRHRSESKNGDFQKVESVEVTGTLSPEDLAAVKAAFTKLNISKLKQRDREVILAQESFIGIGAANGKTAVEYMAVLDDYGSDAVAIKEFLSVIIPIMEKLK